MDLNRNRIGNVILGLAVFAVPVAALAYRFGAGSALALLAWVLAIYGVANLAVYLFARRNKAAKAGAAILYPELLFILFLPRHLKRSLARLEEQEARQSSPDSESGR
ncbi:MAG TPA: hypothetical protein VKA50_06555 [Gammaproteobacteria bacterium]|nr:hypothetical protein [Gammaproteobacteria bacterium]